MATQQDVQTTPVATPTGEGKVKPESEVMTMTVPAEMMETPPAPEQSEEKKPASKEVEVADAPSKEDVKNPPADELTEEDQRRLSDRAQKRIRELNEKAKKADELEIELDKLRKDQEERFVSPYQDTYVNQPMFGDNNPQKPLSGQPGSQDGQLPWNPTPEVPLDTVLSPEEYQRHVLNAADIIVQARMSQYAKGMEIKSDLDKVESKYPELNPDSEEYSEDISKKISKLFEAQLKSDPNAKLGQFVDSIMSLRRTSEEKGKASVTTKIVEQKAEEAVSAHEIEPEPEKTYESMTLAEKEKYLKEKGLW